MQINMTSFAVANETEVHVPVLEMKTLIYWSKSNSWIYFCVVLNKNWKMFWSGQSFSGLGPEDLCWSWGLMHYHLFSVWYLVQARVSGPDQFCFRCWDWSLDILWRLFQHTFSFTKTRYLPVTTESRQECSPASNFPYIFDKKLQFFKKKNFLKSNHAWFW
jgi:hypothetical protein